MNARALQHLVVRMHFDPQLVDDVHSDRPIDDVTDEARRMLRQVDRRAFATDPLRRPRALAALLEELPISAACHGFVGLDAFFRTAAFIDVITQRGSLAIAFATWLAPRVGDVAVLEGALCRARRVLRHATQPGSLVRGPGVEVATVAPGTLAHYLSVRGRLGDDAVRRIVGGFCAPRAPVGDDLLRERLLVTLDTAGAPQIGTASDALVCLLAPDRPRTIAEIRADARTWGADPGDEGEIVADLVRDGLLVGYP